MDERFKNLSHRANTKLGVVWLGVICLVMLAANRFVYTMLGLPGTRIAVYVSYSLIGIILAEIALLAVWTVLSSQSLARRIQFLVFATSILLAAWLLGYMSTFAEDVGINWQNREEVFYLGWLPIIFLAACLPLIALRFFLSRVLAPYYDKVPPVRKPVTTLGLMITTAVVAGVLAAAQLPTLVGVPQEDIWVTSGILSGLFFLVSLLIVLPSVLILFSPRRSFLVWSIIALSATLLLTAGAMFWLLWVLSGPREAMLVAIQVAASAMLVYLFGIATIRSFGYRLVKSEKKFTGPKK